MKTEEEIRAIALGRAAENTAQLMRVMAYIAETIGGEVSCVLSSSPEHNEGIYISRNRCTAEESEPFDRFCELYGIENVKEETPEDGLIIRSADVKGTLFFTLEEDGKCTEEEQEREQSPESRTA